MGARPNGYRLIDTRMSDSPATPRDVRYAWSSEGPLPRDSTRRLCVATDRGARRPHGLVRYATNLYPWQLELVTETADDATRDRVLAHLADLVLVRLDALLIPRLRQARFAANKS